MKPSTTVDPDFELAALASVAPPITAHPEKQLIYLSPQIQERRDRILHEARKLIAQEGIEGFSIRKLCLRAGVVQRTLYNAFHSKDRIIALAIWNAYEEAHRKARYTTLPDTIEGVVDRIYEVNRRNFRAPNFARAIVSLYFTKGLSTDILEALRSMVYFQRLWLERVERAGGMRSGFIVGDVLNDLANLEYSVIHDWLEGRLADEAYLTRLIQAFLTYVYAVTIGPEHDHIGALLERLHTLGGAGVLHRELAGPA